jgi:hypothetical protein
VLLLAANTQVWTRIHRHAERRRCPPRANVRFRVMGTAVNMELEAAGRNKGLGGGRLVTVGLGHLLFNSELTIIYVHGINTSGESLFFRSLIFEYLTFNIPGFSVANYE